MTFLQCVKKYQLNKKGFEWWIKNYADRNSYVETNGHITKINDNSVDQVVESFLQFKSEKQQKVSESQEAIKKFQYAHPVTHTNDKNVIKCPRCDSTAITTGARGVNFMLGLIGASKTVNRCGNCGFTWEPRYRG